MLSAEPSSSGGADRDPGRRLRALAELSQLVIASREPEGVFDAAAAVAARLLGAEDVRLWLHEPAEDVLREVAWASAVRPPASPDADATVSIKSSIAGAVLQDATPLLLERPTEHPGWTDFVPWPFRPKSGLFVPCLHEGRTIGVLAAVSLRERAFVDDDVELLRAIVTQVAAAIQNARLQHDASVRARQLATILDVNKRLALGPNLEPILARITEEAARLLAADAAALRLVEGDELVRAARFGFVQPAIGPERLPLSESPASWLIVSEQRAVVSDDLSNDSRFDPKLRESAADYGFTAWLGVPLRGREQIVGILSVLGRAERRFDEVDCRLLEAFADQAAIAIENARLFREEQERRRQLEAISDVTAEITRELDLTTLLELIWRRAADLVGAISGAIYLWDEAEHVLVPRAWHGLGDWLSDVRFKLGEGVAGMAAQQRTGMIDNNYRVAPNVPAIMLERTAIVAVLGQPLLYRDRLVGVITVNHEVAGRAFGEQDKRLLALFADQAAVAIENARAFEQAAGAEALRELARLKTEFLNTVSHELRTPLSLIHGYSELLIHRAPGLEPGEVAVMAEEIHTGSRTMVRLVDDLLDFSRIEQSRLTVRRRWVALAAVVGPLVETFRHQPGGERITAALPAGLIIHADPERLAQVIGNLLTNALRYTSEGAIAIRAVEQDGRLRVEVADQGPGIVAAEQPRVWEKFYRGTASQRSFARGSGLGLAVVRHLVELHGGHVGLSSTVGQGSTFWFEIPRGLPEVNESE